ncbi:molybdate ABC transporter substrate-binding protein [Frigoribacterium faeni]|uniref:molybdate ABC transporter substrate-binding protein n=1 Tax=Frigoribacterium faeni TaxID=145483 RepID=UPI00141AA5F1|nr:molybdate ABC transporter substrate-binding protein [Frigoribacterium faeni]NIJ05886.1 molybdate transport system substrate-binding protein [Frigoribacterium faeni]
MTGASRTRASSAPSGSSGRRAGARRGGALATLAALGLLLTGCSAADGAPGAAGGATGDPAPTGSITVLAAASLTGPLDEIVDAFEARTPGAEVTVSYGGSSALAQQVVAGSPVDAFLSASSATMRTVADADLVEGEPVTFARNSLQIAVPAGDPGGVGSLADLASPDVSVALCAPEVPCGALAVQVLEAAGVSVVPATLEPDVKSALTKVELGEVDAALVYRTDVVAAGDAVQGVEIGGDDAPTTAYEAARLRDSADPALADAFVASVLSADGRSVLADAGFTVG